MKRCLSVFVALVFIVCTGQSALAADAPENDFAGRVMSRDGRVGIGTEKPAATLDVYHGEIKVGSSGAACTRALAGMLRFTDDRLQVCTSRGWQFLTLGPPAK